MGAAYTIGRILIPVMFLFAGMQKFLDIPTFSQSLAAFNLPIPDEIVPYLGGIPKHQAAAYLIAGIEVLCGLMVLIGLQTRWAALILAVYTACTIILVHHFWDMSGAEQAAARAEALKHLSVLGGLLVLVGIGPGPNAVDRR